MKIPLIFIFQGWKGLLELRNLLVAVTNQGKEIIQLTVFSIGFYLMH